MASQATIVYGHVNAAMVCILPWRETSISWPCLLPYVGIAEVAMVMAGVISAEIMAILRCNSDFSA